MKNPRGKLISAVFIIFVTDPTMKKRKTTHNPRNTLYCQTTNEATSVIKQLSNS